jgi:hypothetical protein
MTLIEQIFTDFIKKSKKISENLFNQRHQWLKKTSWKN